MESSLKPLLKRPSSSVENGPVEVAQRDSKSFKAELGKPEDEPFLELQELNSSPAPTSSSALEDQSIQIAPLASSEPFKESDHSVFSSFSPPALQVHSNRMQVSQASSDPNFYKNACGYSAEQNHDLEVSDERERKYSNIVVCFDLDHMSP